MRQRRKTPPPPTNWQNAFAPPWRTPTCGRRAWRYLGWWMPLCPNTRRLALRVLRLKSLEADVATQSTIEWTEQTWNPTTGCTKVSPGCKNCYAEVMARRLHAMGAPGYENGFKLTLHESRLEQPLLRKKPTTYFVNSMSDLFHEAVPDAFLDRVFS